MLRVGFVLFEVRWWVLVIFTAGFVAAFFTRWAAVVPLAYLSLLLHELGHALVGRVLAGATSVIRLDHVIHGHTTSSLKRPLTPHGKVLYSLTGPLVGILVGVVYAALWWGTLALCGAGVAVVALHAANLVPVGTSDGQKILEACK